MDNSKRFIAKSRRIRKTCSVLIFCLPLLLAISWAFFDGMEAMGRFHYPVGHPSSLNRFLAFLIEMIPLSVVLYGLLRLRKLFLLYENGMIFTEKNVSCFRNLAWALILWVICDVIRYSLLSFVLGWTIPFSLRTVEMTLHLVHFTCLFAGIVTLIIVWVMDEARKIQEEQRLFV